MISQYDIGTVVMLNSLREEKEVHVDFIPILSYKGYFEPWFVKVICLPFLVLQYMAWRGAHPY